VVTLGTDAVLGLIYSLLQKVVITQLPINSNKVICFIRSIFIFLMLKISSE